jgi:hypothetical protein
VDWEGTLLCDRVKSQIKAGFYGNFSALGI